MQVFFATTTSFGKLAIKSSLIINSRDLLMSYASDKAIIITGGAGYIGSAISLLLITQGYKVISIDRQPLHGHLAKEAHKANYLIGIQGDFADEQLLDQLCHQHDVQTVIHCAALIQVHESIGQPDHFYENNVVKTLKLLDVMKKYNIVRFIFSSSAAVYGKLNRAPIYEEHDTHPISPYGKTKLIIEQILDDYAKAYGLCAISLRYFNAAGSWLEYNLGEQHVPETHCIPALLESAYTNKTFTINGNNHSTPDGTAIRDYVHIQDIARAHLAALTFLAHQNNSGHERFNIASSTGHSLLELINITEKITALPINRSFVAIRSGDPAILVGSIAKAESILGWRPEHSSIETIISTAHLFNLQHKQINIG